MKIQVKELGGNQEYTLDVSEDATVKEAKIRIENIAKIPGNFRKL